MHYRFIVNMYTTKLGNEIVKKNIETMKHELDYLLTIHKTITKLNLHIYANRKFVKTVIGKEINPIKNRKNVARKIIKKRTPGIKNA